MVRLGIEAPDEVKVIRGEIFNDDGEEKSAESVRNRRHDLRNQLNQVTLKLELLRRQLEVGQAVEPDRALGEAISDLSLLEQRIGDKVSQPDNLGGIRVLIVEDQAEERELLASCLRLSGMEVASVGDGERALEYLRMNQPPDLVLLDMRMPGIDGPTLLDTIRHDGRLEHVRVFAVSGSARNEFPATAGAVDGWFSKPVRIDALLHAAKLSRDAASV
jgi:CheY-like chemotaxis protein